jgi:RHS repeat-associated protein
MGHRTSYTYGAGSTGNPQLANAILTITTPNAQAGGPDAGDATVNTYDSLGRVTSQTDPMGNQTTINYCASSASSDCLDTATGSGFVAVTNPDSNNTVYQYTQGTEAARTSYTGAVTPANLTSETDSQPDTTTGMLLSTSTTDGNSHTTTSTIDGLGNTTKTVVPAVTATGTATVTTGYAESVTSTEMLPNCTTSAQATSACSADSPPLPVAPGGTIAPPSSAPPLGTTYTLYDTDDNELYSTTGVYQPGAPSAAYSQTTYQLYNGNSVTLPGTSTAITCAYTAPSQLLPCVTINADGVVTQVRYDAQGDQISSATPDGNGSEIATTTSAYDADGELTSTVSPDGNLPGANSGNYTTTTAYNDDGQQTSVTQGGGTGHTVTPRSTTNGYDPDGNPTTVTDARGHTTTTNFDADGRAVLTTNPDGDATLSCYTSAGQLAETVPPAGVAAGSLSPASCPSFAANYSPLTNPLLAPDATMSTYNAAGQKLAVYTPAPAGQTGYETTTYSYDAVGNVLTAAAPSASNGGSSQVTRDTYNSAGKLATQTTGYGTPAASTVSFCYNPDGTQTSVVAADGNAPSGVAPCETSAPWVVSASAYPTQAAYQTTSTFDSVGELASTTSPANTVTGSSGATTSYTYDPEGNVLSSTNPAGVTTTWTYTPDDHPTSMTFSGSSAHSVTYSYDAEDDRTSMSDGTGTSTRVYDPFSEVTSETNGAGRTVNYGYNPDGKISNIGYPLPSSATWATSNIVTYGYDNADTLTSVTDFTGHQIALTPTADGMPNAVSLGTSGDTVTVSYDHADGPSQISVASSAATLASFSYSTAPAGNVLSETDSPSSAQFPATYTYDGKSRVTSMTPGTGSAATYGFDASGNLTTLPTGATGTYNAARELTSSTLAGTGTNYGYDATGDRLTATQGSAVIASGTWNGAGRLTLYNDNTASMTAATYDGTGLRAAASSTPAGGSASAQQFTWGPGTKLLQDSANAYIYAGARTPAEQVDLSTGVVSYLLTDMLGSVRGIIASTGTLTATTAYDAWGNPETTGGLTAYTPFGFTGGYTDPTGLVYLINRYYDPRNGQFLSIDPNVAQTGDPYGYAAGDPVNLTDPTGDRPKGHGYVFSIGRTFTEPESMQFVAGFLCYWPNAHCSPELALNTFVLGKRVVDIWAGKRDGSSGSINEVKTGYQTYGFSGQADKDNAILDNNGAWDMAMVNLYAANWGAWWFLPSVTETSGTSKEIYQKLINYGINIFLFEYRKGQNDKAYDNKKAGNYVMAAASRSYQKNTSVYHYYPRAALCPAGNYWVY